MSGSKGGNLSTGRSLNATVNPDVKEWFLNHAKEKKIPIMGLVRDILLAYYEKQTGNKVRQTQYT